MERVSKMKDDLISIIVPIYNVENYLEKCITSLINQTYQNIEIILIDDGSTDASSDICEKFKKEDDRIIVIHKENGGLSSARNAGIEIANGKFISFVDSDDYVSNDYIEYLYDLILRDNTLISTCGHFICYNKKRINKTSSSDKKVNKITALKKILYDVDIDICSWGKLFDKGLFSNLRFPVGKLFEDTATTYLLFYKCEYISVGSESKYFYVMRDNSITTRKFNLNKMDLIEMTNEMCSSISLTYPELESACNRRKIWAYLSTYTKIVYTPKEEFMNEKKMIKEYINENRKDVLQDNQISKRDRMALLLYGMGEGIYKMTWRIYKKIFN